VARVADWQRKLNVYLLSAQSRYKKEGFVWGKFDCCTFAGDWVRIATGQDVLSEYRGKYSTKEQAMSVLQELDGSLYQALVNRFGEPEHPSKAMRGDIAYREAINGLGIYLTSGARMAALFLGEQGFAMPKAKDTHHAFKVR